MFSIARFEGLFHSGAIVAENGSQCHFSDRLLGLGLDAALGHAASCWAKVGTQIIGTVHAEVIFEVPDGSAEEAAVIVKETMIQAGKVYLGKVPVEVEITIGETWSEK